MGALGAGDTSTASGAHGDVWDLEQRLRRLPGATAFMASLFVDHVQTLRQQGYINEPRGVVQGRWTGCKTQPIPSVKKVTFAEIRAALPRDTLLVTPAQRQVQIRNRRLALEQRALW